MNETLEIFCCYAHQDQPLLFKLKTHLALFEREGLLSIWHDTDISPGTEWEEEINEHLNTAHIILLLVSPDFMSSDYCYSKEMKQAMERHKKGEALVIPILIRPVSWLGAPFGKLQILPRNAQPVTLWRNRDNALLSVSQGIEQSVRAWFTKSSKDSQLSQQIQETTSIAKNTKDKKSIDSPDQPSPLSPPVTVPNTKQPKVTTHLCSPPPKKLERVDIAIITTREDEFEALHQRFKLTPHREQGGRTYGICYVEAKGGRRYTIAVARSSEQGNDSSQKLANDMIHDLNPRLILVVGIAGGVPHDEFTLGDVIVSTRIHNFNVGAQREDGSIEFDIRGGIHPRISDLASNLLLYKDQLAGWNEQASIGQERPAVDPQRAKIQGSTDWCKKVRASLNLHFTKQNRARPPKFKTGFIASSNHLIRNPSILIQWLTDARTILAVEMEAAGIYEAAQQMSHQYPVMAIRGISDIVGLKRDRRWTEYACQTAAAFAYAFIMTAPLDPQVDREPHPSSTDRLHSEDGVSNSHRDWGGAPDRDFFFGRTEELATLEQWIVTEQCRLVAVIGMGGIGKTELSVKLGKGGIGKTDLSLVLALGIQDHFEYVIWRRLLSAPKLTAILVDLVKFLSDQQEVSLPSPVEDQLSRLLSHLRQHRCLLILDNIEAILQGGKLAGQYREGYEEYGQLFRQIAEVQHQSCLLLTSREKPPEIARLDGKSRPVRSLELGGLNYLDAKMIFAQIGSFFGSDEDWRELNEFYNGNPFALDLAARYINDIFSGSIAEFLKEGKPVFADLRDLLDWHFGRLSDAQKEIMYWLAINREPMSLSELKEDILSPVAKEQVSSTLQQLQRLLPLEKSPSRFTLQPVLIEYMTERLVEQVVEEIRMGELELLHTFALLKALAKDYVRDSQVRLILMPIVKQMLSMYGKERSENKLKSLLKTLRETNTHGHSYAGGNILNILIWLECDLRSYDFSHLTIWQANLQGVALPDVNFSHADLAKSVFTETFGSILAVAFSPDNNLIAAGTSDGDVRLWEARSGRPVLTSRGHNDWVWSIAFSPDGQLLASGGSDQTIRLWEVSTGQAIKLLQGHSSWVRSVAFSPDGQLLASGGEDRTIRLWEVSTGKLLKTLDGYPGWIRSLAFSPDGQLLASGGEDQDRTVWLWKVSTSNCLRILQSHTIKVRSLAFSPDGKMLVCGGPASHDVENVCFWEVATGKGLILLKGPNKPTWSVAFSPDGKFLATSSNDHSVRVWNMSTGDCLYTLQGHRSSIRSVSFSPDGQVLASGSEDQTVRLWDTSTGKCLKTLHGHGRSTWSISFSPDGDMMASGDEDHIVRLWDVRSARVLNRLRGHIFRVVSVAFSPDGRLLASGSEDQTVRLWDTSTGSCLKILQGHTHKVRSVAFSFDSSVLVSGGEDRMVRLWDVRSGRELKCLEGHTNIIWTVAYSSNKHIVASGSADKTVRLWNANTGQELQVMHGHTLSVWSIAFSPKGDIVASSSADQTIRLWNVDTGQHLKTLQGHTHRVRSIAFSPDGKLIVSGSEDQTIRLWEARSGKCLKVLQCSPKQIRAIALNHNGQLLAYSTTEGTIEFLDVLADKYLKTLESDRPYEHMNITGVKGLTEVQKATLKTLGAFEEGNEERLENQVLDNPPP